MRPLIFNQFIYFYQASVKFMAFVEALDWAAAGAGRDAQETPSAHFLFCIVAEKGRTLNRSALCFLSSKPMGQFISAGMWKSYFFFLSGFKQLLTQTCLSHICRSGKCHFYFSSVFSLWLPLVGIHSLDRQQHVFVTEHTVWNTSARPFSSCLSKHTCAGKQAVH